MKLKAVILPGHAVSCLGVFTASVSAILLCMAWFYGLDYPNAYQFDLQTRLSHVEHISTPTILLWKPPLWYYRLYGDGRKNSLHHMMDQNCGACNFTNDRSIINEANVVVLHGNFVRKEGDFPTGHKRSPSQLYVFWTKESPYFTKHLIPSKVGLEHFDADFNLTMTYRSDSDVQIGYGCIADALKETKKINTTLRSKTKVAVMLASDCGRFGAGKRILYSDLLIKAGLKLERYGSCFGSRFEGDLRTLLNPFKFFLSFENGIHCREYITEKLWNRALWVGLVPIVWGPTKSDTERIAPKGSYIHVEDFQSAEDLAKYIQYLDRNETAYLEYFRWRNGSSNEILNTGLPCAASNTLPIPPGFCELCRKVRSRPKNTVIPSITQWWYGTESQECLANKLSNLKKSNIIRLIS